MHFDRAKLANSLRWYTFSRGLLTRDQHSALSTILGTEMKRFLALRANSKARLEFDNRSSEQVAGRKPSIMVFICQSSCDGLRSCKITLDLNGIGGVAIRPLLELRKIS